MMPLALQTPPSCHWITRCLLLAATFAMSCLPVLTWANEDLRAKVYDQSLPLEQRINAMQELTGLQPDPDRTYRVCVWDIFGRSGPIYGAAQDQRHRILQYGINVEMVPYTSESVMVEELKSGTCDAAQVFVNDRSINTLAKASGKRVVVLDYDPTQAHLVNHPGQRADAGHSCAYVVGLGGRNPALKVIGNRRANLA
ncbi:putative solute-binding protein [Marinobacter alkaliphilus]|uniref:putative solute-binding protein n=1 Tax=Marinobacter alkaliphilus TaxID=254719 RepID=UPI003D80B0A4|nr:DUF6091 family protein [Marinobacter alkaliphilus]